MINSTEIEYRVLPDDFTREVYVEPCSATDNRGLFDCYQNERAGRQEANARLRAARQWCDEVKSLNEVDE